MNPNLFNLWFSAIDFLLLKLMLWYGRRAHFTPISRSLPYHIASHDAYSQILCFRDYNLILAIYDAL